MHTCDNNNNFFVVNVNNNLILKFVDYFDFTYDFNDFNALIVNVNRLFFY